MTDDAATSAPTFARRLGQLALLAVPVAYVAEILPVVVHEILGHGLSAVLLGGRFVGFEVHLDGMGVAWTRIPDSATRGGRVVQLLSGAIASMTVGAVLLVLASRRSRSVTSRFVLLALAFGCLLEGSSYMLWNSATPARWGDFHEVLVLVPSESLRTGFVVAGAVMVVIAVLSLSYLLLRVTEEWFGEALPRKGGKRLALIALLVLLPGSIWFLFDWDLFNPGLGHTPGFVGMAVHVAAGAVLWALPPRISFPGGTPVVGRRPWIVAWSVATALFLVVWLWWSRGVRWG